MCGARGSIVSWAVGERPAYPCSRRDVLTAFDHMTSCSGLGEPNFWTLTLYDRDLRNSMASLMDVVLSAWEVASKQRLGVHVQPNAGYHFVTGRLHRGSPRATVYRIWGTRTFAVFPTQAAGLVARGCAGGWAACLAIRSGGAQGFCQATWAQS